MIHRVSNRAFKLVRNGCGRISLQEPEILCNQLTKPCHDGSIIACWKQKLKQLQDWDSACNIRNFAS
nr:hypothetical protein Iba_chr13bCG11120 [Ipomoea batatas]